MPDFIRKYPYRFILFISLGCLPVNLFASVQNWMIKAHNFIEKGDLIKAEKHLNYVLKKRKCSSLEKYEVHKLLQTIYLNQQRFPNYIKQIDKAEKVAKSLHPIYMAEVYAHKAYYWHYMMWRDSARVYAGRSIRVFQANRSAMAKIEVPFIYELHAISFLYNNDKVPPKSYLHLDIGEEKQKQFQWFDSALIYDQRFPYPFSIDRSRLYRSYANRWLDLVVSNKRQEKWTKQQKYIQRIAFDKANKLYNQALKHLKPWHLNDYFALKGLIGLNYSVMGQHDRAADLYEKTLKSFSPADLMNRQKIAFTPLMVFLSFKIRNQIFVPYDKEEVNRDIQMMGRLKGEFWKSFGKNDSYPYDPYRISPYISLFNLFAIKSIHEKAPNNFLSVGVSYLLTVKNYFHFLRTDQQKKTGKLPWFDVKIIQKKLKKDECYLFKCNDNEFFEHKKIVILPNKIILINSLANSAISDEKLDTLAFFKFKELSETAYQEQFVEVHRLVPNVKKIFISYDDITPYEILMPPNKATHFRQAPYLGQSINFIRLYNPYIYFNASKNQEINALDARFLNQPGNSSLPFMNNFFSNLNSNVAFTHKPFQGDLIRLLEDKGILHLYGHGELVFDEEAGTKNFQLNYFLSSTKFAKRQLTGNFKVNRSLVVLNNCFSGFPHFNQNEFNRTISLSILSNGAKGIISSPDKVDDYFSAAFFKEFYALIEDGVPYEDAFFSSRKHFFDTHPSMRHPSYWNALQLIQQTKLKNQVSHSNLTVTFWMLSFAVADVLLSLLYATWIRRSIRHL